MTTDEKKKRQQNSDNPFQAMADLWNQSAKAYSNAVQTFFDTAAEAPVAAAEVAGGDPLETARRYTSRWADATVQLSKIQGQLFENLLTDLPRAARERLDAQTFSQLSRMATARWQEEVRRLSEVPAEIGERLTSAAPERLTGLLESMTTEYLRDLQTLKGNVLELNVEHLAKAWERVVSGQADEDDRRTVDRLLQAATTKLKYGSEYYADPDQTPVGQTPREVIFQKDRFTLYRYTPKKGAAERSGDPVLLVYSIINKAYILDLVPGFSFVEHLLDQGLDVYLIDWGETEPGDDTTTLDSYIDPGLRSCVAHIKELTGAERVSLFGHCIGGNLALLYAAQHPGDVARVITLTTPLTAAEGGVVALWTDRDVFPVDSIIDTYGHMPAKLIRYTFMALKPYYEVLKWKMFIEQLHNEQVMHLFYPVDRWANENVDLPGAVFRKFVVEVFHEDRFRRGETVINGRPADLKQITCPVYNLAASKDWICPPESADFLDGIVGSDQAYFTLIEGAHVAIMIDPRARKHWTSMSDFLLGQKPTTATDAS